MAPFTCPYIKRDGTVCGNNCWLPIGCYRHSKLYEKNQKKRPCLICGFPTDADSEYCSKNCSKYSAKFHALNYRMRQKCGAEAPQLAKTSELSNETLQSAKTYELSDGEDLSDGLGLFD